MCIFLCALICVHVCICACTCMSHFSVCIFACLCVCVCLGFYVHILCTEIEQVDVGYWSLSRALFVCVRVCVCLFVFEGGPGSIFQQISRPENPICLERQQAVHHLPWMDTISALSVTAPKHTHTHTHTCTIFFNDHMHE